MERVDKAQGISYSLSTSVYPALLLLPSATHATRTYASISLTAQRHLLSFATLSLASYVTAFYVSPRPARHPYLLWTAILGFGAVGEDVYRLARSLMIGGPSTMKADMDGKGGDEGWEDIAERGVNGEDVERRIGDARRREGTRGFIGGFAFALGVIGLWGDGA